MTDHGAWNTADGTEPTGGQNLGEAINHMVHNAQEIIAWAAKIGHVSVTADSGGGPKGPPTIPGGG